jgi:hypothetical protein
MLRSVGILSAPARLSKRRRVTNQRMQYTLADEGLESWESREDCRMSADEEDSVSGTPLDTILNLTRLQTANGSWDDLAIVLELVKVDDISGNWKPSEAATALAVEALREKGDQYRLIREKGMNWLEQQLGVEDAKRIQAWAVGKLTR